MRMQNRPKPIRWRTEFRELEGFLKLSKDERRDPQHHDVLDHVWTQICQHPVANHVIQRAYRDYEDRLDGLEEPHRSIYKNLYKTRAMERIIRPTVLKVLLNFDHPAGVKRFSSHFNKKLYNAAAQVMRYPDLLKGRHSTTRMFLKTGNVAYAMPEAGPGFADFLRHQEAGKATPEELERYWDQRVWHRFFKIKEGKYRRELSRRLEEESKNIETRGKKYGKDDYKFSEKATLADYSSVAGILAELHPEAKEDLALLAKSKVKQSKYYSSDDLLWAFRKKDKDYLRGIFRKLSKPALNHLYNRLKRRKESFVLAHEQGAAGIFFGDVKEIRRVRAHEFTHAVFRDLSDKHQGLDWLGNHLAVYAVESLFAMHRGAKPPQNPPKQYRQAIQIAEEAYMFGKIYGRAAAWKYLYKRFTTDEHGPKAPFVPEKEGPHFLLQPAIG